MNLSKNSKSNLFAISAVLLWSTVATAFKFTLEGLNFVQLLFYSSLTSLVVLFVFALKDGKHEILSVLDKQYIKLNLLLGFVNPFLYYLILFKAYSLLPAQEAQPLNYTWPIAISIFSVLFLGDKLKLRTIIGLIMAFFGVFIIATRGDLFSLQFESLFGVILAAGSSLIWATFWIINLKDKRNTSIKLFSSFFYGTIFTLIYILLFDSLEFSNPKYLFGAVYIGLFEMGITFFLWMNALTLSENKAKTSTLAYLSPFISMFFIAVILKETILPSSIIGLVFIVGGILYQNLDKMKRK